MSGDDNRNRGRESVDWLYAATMWFPHMHDAASAHATARWGAIGGVAFWAVTISQTLVTHFRDAPRPSRLGVKLESMNEVLIGIALFSGLISILCWRVGCGRGFLSAAFLTFAVCGEFLQKLVEMKANAESISVYLFLLIACVNGIRGNWAGQSFLRAERQ